jgi:hypothetical protein
MSIKTASVPIGATFSPTGGTATAITPLSTSNTDISAYVATAGVMASTRTEVTFSGKVPKVSKTAPGGYSQGRSSVLVKTPKVLANLQRTINTASFSLAIDPETTAAEVAALKSLIVNMITDADFDQFWLNQAVD